MMDILQSSNQMNPDPNLHILCEDLKTKYDCHTVILYGSRARGDETMASDYDLFGIREGSGDVIRDARRWNGTYLDIFIYPESKISNPDESMLHIRQGKVLFQRNHIGDKFLAILDAIFQKGPKPLSPDEVQARKVWAYKMLDRARTEDIEGNYRRAWLLNALLEDYFIIRGQWYLGPKESFKQLQKANPKAYDLYQTALKPNASLSTIEALVEAMNE